MLFPVYAGGRKSEYVNCVVFDEENELIIVGGNTTSGDFGPYDFWPTGFLYAVNMNADY